MNGAWRNARGVARRLAKAGVLPARLEARLAKWSAYCELVGYAASVTLRSLALRDVQRRLQAFEYAGVRLRPVQWPTLARLSAVNETTRGLQLWRCAQCDRIRLRPHRLLARPHQQCAPNKPEHRQVVAHLWRRVHAGRVGGQRSGVKDRVRRRLHACSRAPPARRAARQAPLSARAAHAGCGGRAHCAAGGGRCAAACARRAQRRRKATL